jgi:hypothetical protein
MARQENGAQHKWHSQCEDASCLYQCHFRLVCHSCIGYFRQCGGLRYGCSSAAPMGCHPLEQGILKTVL